MEGNAGVSNLQLVVLLAAVRVILGELIFYVVTMMSRNAFHITPASSEMFLLFLQDTMFDTRVEEDAELSDWEGMRGFYVAWFLGFGWVTSKRCPRNGGFASRRGKTVRNTAGEIVRFREKKWLEKVNHKREHKVVTGCGCMAEMRIKRKDGSGRWYVSCFVKEHNHKLAYGKLVDYLRSHRKISEVEVA
ncbi:hypothetical protein Ahy_A09g042306 isoform A [Arachis hypogaea]|uniref:Protein FAR1-RELATED SEQUENCE n=1 Tax=Arachis hypogaea TaxID=3818 RepID=A0A445BFG4_ARAHY|nr:hypothetical protein Ahy_A09g042306 isoform A [Arachis hypogaea]